MNNLTKATLYPIYPDFDYQRFVQDVEVLFEEKGWLVEEKMEM